MNDDLREELRSEIEDFRTQTKRFLDKELNVKEFKGYSGGFGSYAQRGATSFMLRLRMNQGVKRYGDSQYHVKCSGSRHCLPWGRR